MIPGLSKSCNQLSENVWPPYTPDTIPGLVSTTAKVLHALLKAHRCLWHNVPLNRKVVATRKALPQSWEVVGLECSMEVVPLARPTGVTGPANSDYRRLIRKPYTVRIEPTHLSGRLVSLEVQAAVGLDQFQARDLHPILSCTPAQLCAVVLWNNVIMPRLAVTGDSVRVILRKSRKSTPFRDHIEYGMVLFMRSQLQQLRIPLMPSASSSRAAEAFEKPTSTTFCLPTFLAKGTMPLRLLQVGLRSYSWTMVQPATLHLVFP